MPRKGDGPVDYGSLLQALSGSLGSPPPVAPPPPPMGATPTPQPMPGPAPMPMGTPPAPPMGAPALGPGGPIPMGGDQAALKAYEAANADFLKNLAMDYAAGKISKDDLKKGASYTGTQPYHEWKHENVTHLKELANAQE